MFVKARQIGALLTLCCRIVTYRLQNSADFTIICFYGALTNTELALQAMGPKCIVLLPY